MTTLTDLEDYQLIRSPIGDKIKLVDFEYDPSQWFRIHYTATHTADTVPAHHIKAVAFLAMADIANTLATRVASATPSSFNADSVNQDQRFSHFRKLAEFFENEYYRLTGVKRERTLTASCFVPIETGVMRFTHRR